RIPSGLVKKKPHGRLPVKGNPQGGAKGALDGQAHRAAKGNQGSDGKIWESSHLQKLLPAP
ncbi:MAG: hypothetical protein MSC43_05900, partial [Clostridiales bacterium]|nr:hypothetical protein [Clostridiales bacterium]